MPVLLPNQKDVTIQHLKTTSARPVGFVLGNNPVVVGGETQLMATARTLLPSTIQCYPLGAYLSKHGLDYRVDDEEPLEDIKAATGEWRQSVIAETVLLSKMLINACVAEE